MNYIVHEYCMKIIRFAFSIEYIFKSNAIFGIDDGWKFNFIMKYLFFSRVEKFVRKSRHRENHVSEEIIS